MIYVPQEKARQLQLKKLPRRGDGRGVTRQAQAENARLCLERETKAARDAAERAAIVKQAKPRARTAEEKDTVVDDETRRRAVERLNRPL